MLGLRHAASLRACVCRGKPKEWELDRRRRRRIASCFRIAAAATATDAGVSRVRCGARVFYRVAACRLRLPVTRRRYNQVRYLDYLASRINSVNV